ncbi:hypothetical protein G7B40_015820 [Aetokthonos hydrillicola Thurmond2011]|jgi:hypothetical protein|uniref:Uncharacterized protein n=1 Tax=Aetokthonos hydrillicola Thurmond2011 TaxID=2712845 RepID=A0AAP5I786_9CYAN|nr:hypothetical protein [Aetokthonos hydrillicola]MBO3463346.1 hypothetical protein [Aetokthonos hydrillicola CCALA 1050]MBW4589555.1 hypothetical protein [Aetokthonos hydrillicola CCALA 1050]MDR9896020.1 hypothetical protein [Aetokthonos hydrillicola Thurmond2011]
MIKNVKLTLGIWVGLAVCVSLGFLVYFTSSKTKEEINQIAHQNPDASKPAPHSSQKSKPIFDQSRSEHLTNTAKFISGMKVDSNSDLNRFQNNDSWLSYQKAFDNAWSKLENQQLVKVRQWSQQELQQIHSDSWSIFYPFSGPDFLYAYSFFPKGKEYVLVGLEPVGSVPDLASLSESKRNLKLQEIRSSLYAILQFSFFRTNDMKVDLQKQGVLPILYVFLARTQNRILDMQEVGIDKSANIQPFKKGMIPGVKIMFAQEGESQTRTLYYFSSDLSNEGLKKQPQFSQFINKLDKKFTYLKAASYLMHGDDFSQIKNLILAESSYLLQDDSGMRLKEFDLSKWKLKFYGTYTSPIRMFAHDYQPNLRKIYQSDKSIKPLNFGIGYQFGVNSSNLMLAEAKNLADNKP